MNTPPLMEVSWIDSYAISGDWNPVSGEIEARVLLSGGYLVAEDDCYMVLANTWDSSAETYGDAVAILKRCVLSKHKVCE